MLMEFHITLQGDFWWCRKNVVPGKFSIEVQKFEGFQAL